MYKLWVGAGEIPSPDKMEKLKECEFVRVHTAIDGEYQFLLGAAVIKHNGELRVSFGNSYRGENDDNTILREKLSRDGKSFEDNGRISQKDKGFGRSHGVYLEHKGELYAFCPKARFERIDAYPELKTEAYAFKDGKWSGLGIVLEDYFWPMCEPITLENGSLLMAGLKTNCSSGAVALSDGDVTKWDMKLFPNPEGYEYWGESTVLKLKDRLVAIVRGGQKLECALVSESFDNGSTWSGLEKTNMIIDQSKMYAGKLSNGKSYLLFNARTGKWRDSLCIAVGDELFDKVYIIRYGFETPPKYWNTNEWCYPYAHEADGKLYVVYAKNKEDCEMAVIPVEAL